MLAGNMKLKTFLGVLGLGGATAAGAGGWWYSQRPEVVDIPQAEVKAVQQAQAPTQTTTTTVPSTTTTDATTTSAAPPGNPVDADVMTWVGRDLGASKKKDVTKGKSWKVNVYQDDGHRTANRAKVDLDRDDKWDQKWTFDDDGRISRQIAQNDDEDYTLTEVWNGSEWVAD